MDIKQLKSNGYARRARAIRTSGTHHSGWGALTNLDKLVVLLPPLSQRLRTAAYADRTRPLGAVVVLASALFLAAQACTPVSSFLAHAPVAPQRSAGTASLSAGADRSRAVDSLPCERAAHLPAQPLATVKPLLRDASQHDTRLLMQLVDAEVLLALNHPGRGPCHPRIRELSRRVAFLQRALADVTEADRHIDLGRLSFQINQRRAAAEIELATLRTRYGKHHPDLEAATARLALWQQLAALVPKPSPDSAQALAEALLTIARAEGSLLYYESRGYGLNHPQRLAEQASIAKATDFMQSLRADKPIDCTPLQRYFDLAIMRLEAQRDSTRDAWAAPQELDAILDSVAAHRATLSRRISCR